MIYFMNKKIDNMKTINSLSVLLITVALLLACSDKTYVEKGIFTDKGNSESDFVKTKFAIPAPDSYLFTAVDRDIQDTVLKKAMTKTREESYMISTRGINASRQLYYPAVDKVTVHFVPVIDRPRTLLGMNPQDTIFRINKEFACFYGKGKNGENIYYTAYYKDRSSVTKDTNRSFYEATKKVHGQEFADEMIEKIRNTKGADRWKVTSFSQGDIMFQLFEYARSQSDNDSFFLLTRGGGQYFDVCYFKGGELFSCKKTRANDVLRIKTADELIK